MQEHAKKKMMETGKTTKTLQKHTIQLLFSCQQHPLRWRASDGTAGFAGQSHTQAHWRPAQALQGGLRCFVQRHQGGRSEGLPL